MASKDLPIYLLLCLGILLSALALELNFFPLTPHPVTDFRWSKEVIAIAFAGAIFLWGIFIGRGFKCKNPWLLLLVGYFLVHPFISPSYELPLGDINIGGFWEYKPILYSFLYFGMFCVIADLRIPTEYIDAFFLVVLGIGVMSAGYIWLQQWHLDQFQRVSDNQHLYDVTGAALTATFTQPNYSAAFIALTCPLALYFRRWWTYLFLCCTVTLINSKMAIFCMFVGPGFMAFKRYPRSTVLGFSVLMLFAECLLLTHNHLFLADWNDSGRFNLWHQVLRDCKHFFIFGHGLGAYRFAWVPMHPGAMAEVHLEWLQLLFDGGFVADLLLFFSTFWLLKRINLFTIKDGQTIALLAIFFGYLVCSFGLFIWQIEPHRFLAVAVFALLHNKLNTNKGAMQ